MALVEISAGVGMFTVVVLALVAIILGARSRLVVSGDVSITINDDPDHSVITTAGGKLLNVLADNKIFVSSACGGGGTSSSAGGFLAEGGGGTARARGGGGAARAGSGRAGPGRDGSFFAQSEKKIAIKKPATP